MIGLVENANPEQGSVENNQKKNEHEYKSDEITINNADYQKVKKILWAEMPEDASDDYSLNSRPSSINASDIVITFNSPDIESDFKAILNGLKKDEHEYKSDEITINNADYQKVKKILWAEMPGDSSEDYSLNSRPSSINASDIVITFNSPDIESDFKAILKRLNNS